MNLNREHEKEGYAHRFCQNQILFHKDGKKALGTQTSDHQKDESGHKRSIPTTLS